jgi:hypothetical protein
MKAFVKLVVEFVGWRWAPAVALLAASMLYVGVVVGLVPSEIGVPVGGGKLAARLNEANANTASSEQVTNTYVASTAETTQVSAPATPVRRPPVAEFGRRGFSPPIDRPEPLASPTPAPPAPVPVMTGSLPTRGPLGGIFSRIQGALRPGAAAAQALAQAQSAAPPVPPAPSAAAPPAPATGPAPGQQPAAPAEGAAPAPPDNGAQQPPGAAPAPGEAAPPGAPPGAPEQPHPPGAGEQPQPQPPQ